jgi:hypothetical protein
VTQAMIRVGAVAVCIAGSLLACASGPVEIGSKPGMTYDATRPRFLSSSACGFILFAVLPFNLHNGVERASAQLATQAGGDYLTDVKIGSSWSYALVGTVHCVQMQAVAYPLSEAAAF